jgi:ABC-type nickel/cobalt efflux system permease component RcnA
MKRAAVLSIATFYLLLTTGMFVCLVHCTGQSLMGNKMAMQAMNHKAAHHHHKHNSKSDDCDCCKKHGNYVIKENIKPAGIDAQSPAMAIVTRPFQSIPAAAHYIVLNTFKLSSGKAPPGLSGKAIAIQQRSLQI